MGEHNNDGTSGCCARGGESIVQRYVRINEVEAFPMKFGEFKTKYPKSGGANVERGADDDGYVIVYRGGEYVSWCPKKEFEDVSRPCDGLTFGHAIEMMKRGKRVARKGWNGKGMWLCIPLFDGSRELYAKDILGEQHADFTAQLGNFVKVVPYVTMKAADDSIVTGWLASQTDMLAEDWVVVE